MVYLRVMQHMKLVQHFENMNVALHFWLIFVDMDPKPLFAVER